MADKGKQQRKQYVPSALMQRYMRMDPQAARSAQTSSWLEGLQQERRSKQSDASGLGTLADIADIMTGGGKQYVAGEVIGRTLSALGINPVEHVVNYAMQNPEVAGLAAAAFGGRKLRNAGKAAAADARTLRGMFAPPTDPVRGGLREEFANLHATQLTPKLQDGMQSAAQQYPDLGRAMQFMTPLEIEKVLYSPEQVSKMNNLLRVLPSEAQLKAVAKAGEPKRGWYRASTQAILDVFGDDAPRFTALLAATSPRVSVEANLQNALSVWMNWNKLGRPTDPRQIKAIMGASVQGSGTEKSVLDAWLNNSISALTTPDYQIPQLTLSGPKVNSFFGNLADDVNRVTLDAWMANGLGVQQGLFSGSGAKAVKGDPGMTAPYGTISGRIRAAGNDMGQYPSEMQEQLWSMGMPLYEEARKLGMDPRDFLMSGMLTPQVINAVPDFSSVLKQPRYRNILGDSQYGQAVDNLQDYGWPTRYPQLTNEEQNHVMDFAGTIANLQGDRSRETRSLKVPVQGRRPDSVFVYASPETMAGKGTGSGSTSGVTPQIDNPTYYNQQVGGAFIDQQGHDRLARALFPNQTLQTRSGQGLWTEPANNTVVSNPMNPIGVELPLEHSSGSPTLRDYDRKKFEAMEKGRGIMTQQLGMGYTGIAPTPTGKSMFVPAEEGAAPVARLMAGHAVDPKMYMVDTGAGTMAINSSRNIGRGKGKALQRALEDPALTVQKQGGFIGTNVGGYVDNSAFLKKPMGSGTLTRQFLGMVDQLTPTDQNALSGALQASADPLHRFLSKQKGGKQLRVDVMNLIAMIKENGIDAVREGLKRGAFLPTVAALSYLQSQPGGQQSTER